MIRLYTQAMKSIPLLLVMLTLHISGQEMLLDVLPLAKKEVVYKNVLEVPGISKIDLQEKSLKWFEKNKIPIEVNKPLDDTHQFLSGNYAFKALWGPNDFKELQKTVECKVGLTLKNNRYQYQISSFMVRESNKIIELEIYKMDKKRLQQYNRGFYERIDVQINKLIMDLEDALR